MPNTGECILVVDDVEDVREGIKSLLEAEGFAVCTAENGLKALQIIKNKKINLVITDVLMPEMDGIEMCQEIKADHPDMLFILVSGGGNQFSSSGSYDYLHAAKKITGINDVLKKPFEPEKLVELVKEKIS